MSLSEAYGARQTMSKGPQRRRQRADRNRPLSRYATPKTCETQYEPGSHGTVLLNRLGVCSKREMDRLEYDALLKAQEAYVEIISAETRFTAESICEMHRAWLGDIYEWAGQYRSVDVTKRGFRWPPAVRVAENMAKFEDGLLDRNTPCQPADVAAIARRIAEVHADLLLIHPFREGNGRLARWLSDLMALQGGLAAPDYGFTGRGSRLRQRLYLEAVIEGYSANYEPLTAFFVEALERRLRTLWRIT